MPTPVSYTHLDVYKRQLLDTAQCRKLQNELCKIIDPEKDSLRFYYLGKKYENKIEHFGCKQTYLPEEPMIL